MAWSQGPVRRANRLLKNAICGHAKGVTLQPSSLQRTMRTPHSSGFARLAFHRLSPTCGNQAFSTGC